MTPPPDFFDQSAQGEVLCGRCYLAWVAGSRTLPIGLVRGAVDFADRLGWDIDAMLSEARVSPQLLREGRSRVTEDQLVSLVRTMWRTTDDELFGLSRFPLPRGTFRLLCYALLGAADLREALERLEGFLQALPAIPASIEIGDETTAISLSIEGEDDPDHLMSIVGLGAAHRLLSWMLRRTVKLARVELPFPRPAERESLEFVFDSPLVFGSPTARIVFDSSLLGAPLMRDERDVEEFVNQSPAALLRRPDYRTTVSEQVRRLLEVGLRTGEFPSSTQLAAQLAVSSQTLRRRLAEEDTSVRALLDDVRRDAAISSLVDTDETVAELSERLGFSEQSAFTRAFRRWTGSTPGAYRRSGDRVPPGTN